MVVGGVRIVLAGQLVEDRVDVGTANEHRRLGGNIGAAVRVLSWIGLSGPHIGLWTYRGLHMPDAHLFEQFDCSGIEERGGSVDICSFSTESGEPRFLSRNFTSRVLRRSLPTSYRSADYLVLNSLDPASVMPRLASFRGRLIVNHSSWWSKQDLLTAAKQASVVVMNRIEAHEIFGVADPRLVADALSDGRDKPMDVFITRDVEGVNAYVDSQRYHLTALRTTCRWKYGAGFIFAVIYAFSRSLGLSSGLSTRLAVDVASLSVTDDVGELMPIRALLSSGVPHVSPNKHMSVKWP